MANEAIVTLGNTYEAPWVVSTVAMSPIGDASKAILLDQGNAQLYFIAFRKRNVEGRVISRWLKTDPIDFRAAKQVAVKLEARIDAELKNALGKLAG